MFNQGTGTTGGPTATTVRPDGRLTAPAPERLDERLGVAVARLRDALAETDLPLPLAGTEDVRRERAEVLAQLDDYVLPRLAGMDRPPLVVVGGPTGVGKSTLVNSLLGQAVTQPGLLRPTTRSPVLVHHPAEGSWFSPERVLPTLPRVERTSDDPGTIQMVASSSVPRGMALMDAPDFDSVDDKNREVAAKLLAAADVWLFVTSAARYSDQLPWQHLELALQRDATVVVVMNRIPPEDRERVSAHLGRMLDARGFPRERSFFVENGPVDEAGALPADQVAELKAFLQSVSSDTGSTAAMVAQTLGGSVRRSAQVAPAVADAATLQQAALDALAQEVEHAVGEARAEVVRALADGSLLRGQFAAQWHEFSGVPADAGLAQAFGAVRTRAVAAGAGIESELARLELALSMALENLVVAGTERAARRIREAVRSHPHGGALTAWSEQSRSADGRTLRSAVPRAIGAWQQRLADAVRQELVSSDLADGLTAAGIRSLAVTIAVHAVSAPGVLTASHGAGQEGLHGLVATAADSFLALLDDLLATERRRHLDGVPDPDGTARACARLRESAAEITDLLATTERSPR